MIKFRLEDGTYMNVEQKHVDIFKQQNPNASEMGKLEDFSVQNQAKKSSSTGLDLGDGSSAQPKNNLGTEFYDYKANSKAYEGSNWVSSFFDRLSEEESEKGLNKVEETDEQAPSYYGFKANFKALGMGDNWLTDFAASNASEMYRSLFEIGGSQAKSTSAGWDVMSNGKRSSPEELEAMVDAANNMPEQTDAVKAYSDRYEQLKEEDGGTMAFMVGVAENPKYVRDVALSSLGNMVTSLVTSPDTVGRAIVGGIAGMGASKLPGIGKGLGFLSGFMGSLSGSMDAAQTYSQLMQEQLAEDGKDFTPENIKSLLNDQTVVNYKDPNGNSSLNMTGTRADILKRRSIRRGIAIGVIDGLTTLTAGRTVQGKVGKIKTSTKRNIRGTGEAMAGGIASEVGGQTFGGQEYDAGEILTEGIAEKGIATTGVTVLPQLLKKSGKYKIGNQEFSEAKFVEEINKMDDMTLAEAKVTVENDSALDGLVKRRQGDAYIDSQINPKVNDPKDRAELVKKQKELAKAQRAAAVEKERDDGDTSAAEKVVKIKAEIAEVVGKYSGIDGRTSEVKGRKAAGKKIKKARQKIYLEATEQFAEVSSEQLDFDPYEAFDTNEDYVGAYVSRVMSGMDLSEMTPDQIAAEANRLADEANNSDGVNVVRDADGRGQIMINREIAAEYGAMNVGSHEVLHAVMEGAITKMEPAERKVVIKQFKSQIVENLGQKVLDLIDTRLRVAYGKKDKKGNLIPGETTIDLEETSEWFTALSDVIEDKENNITYRDNKGFFDKIKDNVANLFNKSTPYEKLSIETGEQAFNFMKEYSKSVKAGKLSESMVEFAGRDKTASGSNFSKSRGKLIDDINDLQEGATTKAEFQKPGIFNNVFKSLASGGAVNNYIRSLQMSPEKTQETIDSVTDRLINFNPEAKRKNGAVIGPRGLGEFMMANVGFGKLDAAKSLFEAGEKAKREESIDSIEARQIEDKPTTKRSEPKGQKARVLTKISEVIYSVANSIGLNSKIQTIVNANPKNLEQQLRDLITKEITKAVKAQMGKISKIKGKVEISEEYKEFLALNYANIVQSLDVATIKNNYNQLFELTEIGKEDRKNRKTDKPSNYRKGIFEIKTNKAKFTKFFTEGGYTTLLDRQKKLATIISESLAEDIINNEIIENSKDANAVTKAKLREFAKSLDRQKKELQGNYKDIINFSKQNLAEANFLMDELSAGKEVFGPNGVLLPKYSNISKEAASFVYRDVLGAGLALDKNDSKYIQKAYQKLFDAGKRGEAYETAIIDQIIGLEKVFGTEAIEAILRKPTEKGGKPDAIIRIYDQVINIEAKMSNAQYSSVTFAVDKKTGKFVIKKDYSFNEQILPLGEAVQKRVKVVRARLAEEGYSWDDISTMPTNLYNMLKNESVTIDGVVYNSYINALSAEMEIDLDVVSEIYNKKKYATNVIQMMGRGLFYMGGFNDTANMLGLPPLKGKAKLTLRVGSTSQYKTVNKVRSKTGNTRLSFRAIPTISPATLNTLKSNKSIGTAAGTIDLMNSKEVLAIKRAKEAKDTQRFSRSINKSRLVNPPKGITVLDFDDTLATSKSLIRFTRPDGTKGTLNAEQYASTYEELTELGYAWDFSEFNKVVDGKTAPLFNKAMKLQSKFGPENMFVLTARPAEAAPAIFAFLQANGLNIPLENITGLANSTAESKALWISDKVSEGYNDFYFADDALQNVQAVDNMLEQFDVKRKVQQAKVDFSKSMNNQFNNILENVTGINSEKRFSAIKARKRGDSKGKFRLFIPPSHEDFVGLLYNFMGKGKKGDKHRDFFEQALVRPLNRAYREIDTAKQAVANDYKALNEQFPDVKDKLIKNTPDGDFTFQDAIRVYLWAKHGYKIPGLTPTDQQNLVDLVMGDPELRAYAETLNIISKQEKYVDPGPNWETGNIRIDLVDATGRVGRAKYFAEFNENAEVIFSEENLNKIEAGYGKDFREALEDMLHRTKTGINRPKGSNAKPNAFMNWLNASVAGVMFFNTRSALLQQMSNVNYLNFADNNIYAAGKAFANQKQYWKDFAMIFNSDMMKQRRGGLGTDINGAELAEAIKKARPGNMFDQVSIIVGKALKLGFLPTQIGDNIAIATGGAAFYRNRVNKYIGDGMSIKDAENAAFTDFQNITQSTQQSARPDMTSQQQASWIGKIVLNFLNTPSQYNRIIKKAASDLLNKRTTPPNETLMQSNMSNMSRILYYGAAQNLIFYTLQTALFAVMFGTSDDDEEAYLKKKERVISGSIDTILRGAGIYGVAVSTLKNMAIKFMEQREKGYNKDESAVLLELANFSPVVGIKLRRIVNAEKTINYNGKIIEEMEAMDIDNPAWSAATNYTQSLTGAPVNKMYQKTINLRNASDSQYTALQRILFLSGYTTWSLNLGDTDKMKGIKEDVKKKKKEVNKEKNKVKKQQVLKDKEVEGRKKQERERKQGKKITCLVCKTPIKKGQRYCTIHEKVKQRNDGKKYQCRQRKSNGKRCGMQTSSKSQLCYYHD